MPRRPDFDVVILGGGLAGLSLAVRLAPHPHLRVLVIEPRTAYKRDRTWCYWRLHDHPFGSAVAARWHSWEVMREEGGRTVRAVQTSAGIPYEMIPADRIYDGAHQVLCRAPAIELWAGCRAGALVEGPDGVRVETERGPIEAGLVLDSRPPPGEPGDLVQRFLGQEVVVDRPVFDPSCVTLMDFAVPSLPGVVHFLYVLPTSSTTALVEDTWLAPAAAALPDYRQSIREYLGTRFGVRDFTVEFEEEGAIPMSPGLQAQSSAGRVVAFGTAGGAVKPSSGYGFMAIQRMADALARELSAGRRPRPVQPRGAVMRWMDAVLLTALRETPQEAPWLFESLFAGCPPESLVRFLNDLGSLSDTARVVAAMPKGPMMTAAMAQMKRR